MIVIDDKVIAVEKLPSLVGKDLLPISADAGDIVADFLSGRAPTTMLAYSTDLQLFANFLGVASVGAAAKKLFGGSAGQANRLVLAYKSQLLERKLSPATINRRLASLRTFANFARTIDAIQWTLSITAVKQRKSRKTEGPDIKGVEAILNQAAQQLNPVKAARDTAMIWLLFAPALRRSEVLGITIADLNLAKGKVRIMGKGRREKESITLPPEVVGALTAWLGFRGTKAGPLFVSVGRKPDLTKAITPRNLFKVVASLGNACGIRVWPHALRHSGITAALDLAPIRSVQRFSRHADPKTLMVYDDDRRDLGGDVARLVAAKIKLTTPEDEIP